MQIPNYKSDKARFYKVESKSIPGKFYDVRVMLDGTIKCSCPLHVFKGVDCRHIVEIAGKSSA
jgi:hypothetical protein